MKVSISEGECYPCYSVYEGESNINPTIDVPDEVAERWFKLQEAEHQLHTELKEAYNNYYEEREKRDRLKELFEEENPSRSHKRFLLEEFGWKDSGVSKFAKDGVILPMHEAYEQIKQQFLSCTD